MKFRDIQKYLAYGIFALAIIYSIVGIVGDIVSLTQISQYNSTGYGNYIAYLYFAGISEIVAFLSIGICSGFGIKRAFDGTYDDITVNLLTYPFTFKFFIGSSVSIYLLSVYSSMGGYYDTRAAVLGLVLDIIAVVLLASTSLIKFEQSEILKKVLIVSSFLYLLVLSIVSLISSGQYDAISVIMLVLVLLVSIASCIFGGIFETDRSYYSKIVNKVSKPNPTYVYNRAPLNQNNNDPAQQLRRIKQLFDEGLITADEYEEKRKKYIDQL